MAIDRMALSSTGMTKNMSVDTRFWMLISPALPVGGYSFSHGIESAIATGAVTDFESTKHWVSTLAERVLPSLELPIVARLIESLRAGDVDQVNYWNDIALATRESRELLLEEREKGRALVQLFPALGIEPAIQTKNPSFSAAFAQVCHQWEISIDTALCGYAWIWYEMLVTAAVKLVPLGHSDGQRLLLALNGTLDGLLAAALECRDEDIGASAPSLAMLSSAHETQHARLFRS